MAPKKIWCLIFLSLFLNSCGSYTPENKAVRQQSLPLSDSEEYSIRIRNIFRFAADYGIIFSANSTYQVYVLPAEKCEICNESKIGELLKGVGKSTCVTYFILSATSTKIATQIDDSLVRRNKTVLVDTLEKLPGYGLSFAENLSISIRSRSVIGWKFM